MCSRPAAPRSSDPTPEACPSDPEPEAQDSVAVDDEPAIEPQVHRPSRLFARQSTDGDRATALYDFEAESPFELSVREAHAPSYWEPASMDAAFQK